jgi:undecaprenol kinase/diacylglycerol kinase (ATP)
MINTAIEICVDLASPEYHPLAKIAKDVAAGAVLANAILSIIVGLCIFGPYLWHLL